MGKEHLIVVLGAAGVGKSALTVRFLAGRFLHRYDPTLEDEYCTQTQVAGDAFSLRILDTAGHAPDGGPGTQPLLPRNYCSCADVLLVAFSLTDRRSLDAARDILLAAREEAPAPPPAVLVGTKSDLAEEREISREALVAVAKELGCAYTETSAAAGENVAPTFQLAAQLSASFRSRAGLASQDATSGRPAEGKSQLRRVLSSKRPSLKRKKKVTSPINNQHTVSTI